MTHQIIDSKADSIVAEFEGALAAAAAHEYQQVTASWIGRFPSLAADFALIASESAAERVSQSRSNPWEGAADTFDGVSDVEAVAIPQTGGSDAAGNHETEYERILRMAAALAAGPIRAKVISGSVSETGRSLAEHSESVGISFPGQLGKLLHIPEALIVRLHRGDIDPLSIPAGFVREAAYHLGLALNECVSLLNARTDGATGPTGTLLPIGMAVAEGRPTYGRRPTFAEALESTGDAESIDYWNQSSR